MIVIRLARVLPCRDRIFRRGARGNIPWCLAVVFGHGLEIAHWFVSFRCEVELAEGATQASGFLLLVSRQQHDLSRATLRLQLSQSNRAKLRGHSPPSSFRPGADGSRSGLPVLPHP